MQLLAEDGVEIFPEIEMDAMESGSLSAVASSEGDSGGLRLRPIKTGNSKVSDTVEDSTLESSVYGIGSVDDTWADEPMTPAGRVFTEMNATFVCVCILGFKYTIDRRKFKSHLELTLMKHKRFASRVEIRNGRPWWTQVETSIDDHVFEVNLTPEQKEDKNCVVNYTTDFILPKPFHESRPLWDIHIVDAKVGDAAGCCIIRIHHSLGDGTSLISLLMACTRIVEKPDMLPGDGGTLGTAPVNALDSKSEPNQCTHSSSLWRLFSVIWRSLLVVWYSLAEIAKAAATLIWLKDSTTVIKGFAGIENTSRVYRFATVPVDDMKYISKVVGVTVNDVYMAMTAYGLRRYLEHRAQKDFASEGFNPKQSIEGKQTGNFVAKPVLLDSGAEKKLDGLRIRAVALINMRSSPGLQELSEMMKGQVSQARWGNHMGYLLVPIPMKLHTDPLKLLSETHAIGNRKKSSLEGPFSYATGDLLMRLFGQKAAAAVVTRSTLQTSMSMSNVRGPSEHVMFADNPITHIIPTVTGHPHSLTLHLQSYNGEAALVAMSVKALLPDPEYLLQLCIEGLHEMKMAAEEKSQKR